MDNLIESVFLISAVTGVLIYVALVWNFKFWKKRGIKGPQPSPLYGNITGLLSLSMHMTYDLDRIYQEYKGKERFVGYFVSTQPRLMILDPKLIRDILIANFRHFQNNDIIIPVDPKLDKLLSQNPFFLRGPEWKEKRAEITPALTASRIKASYPIMTEVCKKLSKFVESEFENPPPDGIEAKELAARYTIEVVSSAIFGIEAGAFSKGECRIRKEGSEIISSSGILDIAYFFLVTTFPLLQKIFYYSLITKKTEEFFTKLMRDAIKLREETKDDRIDFLNYLLQLQKKKNLSELDMASHTLSFFIDGFETSSVLISHVIHMLAKHKEVQEKLREELKGVLSEDGTLQFEKLSDLPYFNCVINETLRLFPPIPFLSKICTERTEFTNSEGNQIPIENGIVTLLPIYSIHRDPEYYEDPNKFLPDRFSEEHGGVKKYKDMGVFFPFGDGPRICLGMRFALTQAKAAIAELTLNWQLTLNKKTKPEFNADPKHFLFVMDGGVWVDYKKIHEPKKTV